MKKPPCYPEERIVLTLREKLDQNARLIVRHRFPHALNEVVVLVDAFLRCLIGFVCGHRTEALESLNLLSNGMILSTTVPPSGLHATCSLAWIGITAQWREAHRMKAMAGSMGQVWQLLRRPLKTKLRQHYPVSLGSSSRWRKDSFL